MRGYHPTALLPRSLPTRLSPAVATNDACNDLVEAASSIQLRRILLEQLSYPEASTRPRFIFFDLDECLVMPAAPFIDGLPGSDALVRRLLLPEEMLEALKQQMREAYYRAPITLVDAGLPTLIADLRARGVIVHGLTSREAGPPTFAWQAPTEPAWHNRLVVEALRQHHVHFSSLPPQLGLGNDALNTAAGGILYSGGANKAVLMQRVTRGQPSTLIDNSERKLWKATSFGRACVHGVHFTAAWAREASDAERRSWIVSLATAKRTADFGI